MKTTRRGLFSWIAGLCAATTTRKPSWIKVIRTGNPEEILRVERDTPKFTEATHVRIAGELFDQEADIISRRRERS